MDPQASLEEQERLMELRRKKGPLDAADKARLKELRVALVDWLKGGGYEPRWSSCPRATRYYAGKGVGGSIGPQYYGARS